jgi:putative transposase
MDHQLDGEAAEGRAKSRNGYGKKTLLTDTGKLPISAPRDGLSTFDPQLLRHYRKCWPGRRCARASSEASSPSLIT